MGGQLIGAKLTEVRYTWTADQAHYAEWAKHFRDKGWFSRTFDYSCDEPPNGCSWTSINARTAMVHAADPQFRTLVTTQLAPATDNGVLAGIDVLVPTVGLLDPDAAVRPTRAPGTTPSSPSRRRSGCGCTSRATRTAATGSGMPRCRAGRRT